MQAIMETLFDAAYLATVITLGLRMIRQSEKRGQYFLFGIMAVTLGAGDAFHLIPRAYALWTTGLESHAALLGIGKLITSITMTAFYLLLYFVWRRRYRIAGRHGLTAGMGILAASRVLLCLLPQNEWTSVNPPLVWGILRNIPFALMGLLVIALFAQSAKAQGDAPFRPMALTIILSFAFYIPVVLFADAFPPVGMLMIPKTCAYVWTVLIGYHAMKHSAGSKESLAA